MFERNFKTELQFARKSDLKFRIQLKDVVACLMDKHVRLGTKVNLPTKV
jgi:hypothetical protein